MERFPIRRSRKWWPLLLLVGATATRAELAIDPDQVVATFGWYRLEVSRAQIAAVELARWPWWWGVGWRIGRRRLGLIGATGSVLCLHLAPPCRTRLLGISLQVRELCVSVDNPDAVRATLAG